MPTKVLLLLSTLCIWRCRSTNALDLPNEQDAIDSLHHEATSKIFKRDNYAQFPLTIGSVSSQTIPQTQPWQLKCERGRALRKITKVPNGQIGVSVQSVYCAQWIDNYLSLYEQQSTGEQLLDNGSVQQCPTGYAASGIKCLNSACDQHQLYCSQFTATLMDENFPVQFTAPGNLTSQCGDDQVIVGTAIGLGESINFRCASALINSASIADGSLAACTIDNNNNNNGRSSGGNNLKKRGLGGFFSCFCPPPPKTEIGEPVSQVSCFKVQLMFLSYILDDGLGDAVGLARTIDILLKLYPNFNFKVFALDETLFGSGFKKLEDTLGSMGHLPRVQLQIVTLGNSDEVCGSLEWLVNSPRTVFFEGPAEASSAVCKSVSMKARNVIQILELGTAKEAYGFNPYGRGMPIPSASEFEYLSTARFTSKGLQTLFSQKNNQRIVFAYMKGYMSISRFIKTIDDFIGKPNDDPLDVILLGYDGAEEDHWLRTNLCRYNPRVMYLLNDGTATIKRTVACDTPNARQINVHHFNGVNIVQTDFLLAMAKSLDIVGVTGDQSFLEALALGKIPIRDFVPHKRIFTDSWRDFMKARFPAKSPLLRFSENYYNPLEFPRKVNISELPTMKSDINKLVEICRNEFNPFTRLKSVIDETLSKL